MTVGIRTIVSIRALLIRITIMRIVNNQDSSNNQNSISKHNSNNADIQNSNNNHNSKSNKSNNDVLRNRKSI